MMGVFLRERYQLNSLVIVSAQIEEGPKWYGTHSWLEHDGLIIDITADQFFETNEPVIVAQESAFHNRYAKKVNRYPFRMSEIDLMNWMLPLYRTITERVLRDLQISGSA